MASHQELFNPLLPEFHADPYPFYHRLRSVAPVYQAPMGLWVLTRYDDVVMVLRDGRSRRDGIEQLLLAADGGVTAAGPAPGSMQLLPPPAVQRVPPLLRRSFHPTV